MVLVVIAAESRTQGIYTYCTCKIEECLQQPNPNQIIKEGLGQKSSGVRGVTAGGNASGSPPRAAAKAVVQRGTGHKALCFCFWLYLARVGRVVHAAAAAVLSATVGALAAPALAPGAVTGSHLVDWSGEV